MKDSDLEEVRRTTSAVAAAEPHDGNHGQPSRKSKFATEGLAVDVKLNNASTANLAPVPNSPSSDNDSPLTLRDEVYSGLTNEPLERVLNSLLQDLVDEHDLKGVDEERDEISRVSVPKKFGENKDGSGVKILERASNSPNQNCKKTSDNITDAPDKQIFPVTKGQIKSERVGDTLLRDQDSANDPKDEGKRGQHVDRVAKGLVSEVKETCKKGGILENTENGEKPLHSSQQQEEKRSYLSDAGNAQDSERQYEVTTTKGMKADTSWSSSKGHRMRKASKVKGSMSSLSSVGNPSSRSVSSRSVSSRATARTVPRKQKGPQFTPLISAPSERNSLLTRGMSLFNRNSKQARTAKYDDASSVISELSQDVKSVKSVSKFDKHNDDALKQHLEESGLVLLKRLIEFLSECPPSPEESSLVAGRKKETPATKQKKRQRGLTLPASAIGWLSTQIDDSCSVVFEDMGNCYQIPKQQLRVLQTLFKRVTSLRITGEAWPPPHASTSKATNTRKVGMSSKILSTFAGDLSIGGDSFDDESCVTSPSLFGEMNEKEIVVSAFQRYYHGLQYKPDVNMSFFPNATKVVIDGIPPNWIANLDLLQNLDMFQIEKGCILDINQLFFPSDISHDETMGYVNQKNPSLLRRDLSLIDEGKEKQGYQPLLNHRSKPENSSLAVYPSLSKLRISSCAMGEGAGLRGRRTSKSVPRLPTLSRFPNLMSLNLSQNELFKTKTVFAGLSSLPLLSSINLSYNRLSSLDDIFMHIGNVTELILTGNEISSTRGLDRLFSLERLSLDENNINNLANIAGIAKIPFLMNFDLKGNPYFETDDPSSCRTKVFNLFREVRCSNLPKNATFRDMQRLLPVLDNELATKDELVALKDLTFRQTVISVDSMLPAASEKNTDSKNIDDSSEISVNMPDSGSGGIKRIVKSSPTKAAHFRMAGSASLENKAGKRLERFHCHVDSLFEGKGRKRRVGIKFDMAELITSIRPEINTDDNATEEAALRQTFSSHRSEVKDDTVASSPDVAFPYTLPPTLLAEADDDAWTPSARLDLIVPLDAIVWDIIPSDDDMEQSTADALVQKKDDVEHDDATPPPSGEEPSENVEPYPHANFASGSSYPNDERITSVNHEQGSVEEDGRISDFDNAIDDISDLKPRKSMFGGIWEQSYRDNVTKNNVKTDEHINSTEKTTPELLDFNAAEQMSQYDGPSDYGPLFVSSDLDLYFDSYIFHRDSSEGDLQVECPRRRIMAPRIQLFKFDRDLLINSRKKLHGTALPSSTDFHERYIGVWKEDVLACGSYARTRLTPIQRPKRGFHGETVAQGGKDIMISEGRKFVICLSDSALYFIIDDGISPNKSTGGKRTFPSRVPPNSTFNDAQWPHAVVRHSLDSIRGITIGFQFQRLTLRFSVGDSTTLSSLEYAYVILTSNKLHTVSFLQKIQSYVSDTQSGMGTLIDNDDKAFLDALGAPKSNEVVIHYQILHQFWKRGDREASRRAFVLTDSKAYLLDESFNGDGTKLEAEKGKKLGDVSLAIIDSAVLSRVTEVRAANEDPRKITLVILPQNKLMRSHRWRLVCNDGEGAERLIDDVRKAMRGNLSTR